MTISLRERLPSFGRIGRTAAVAAMAAMFLGTTAIAANVHLKGGKNAEPSFQDLGLALQAAGSLVGLGNGDVLISLFAEANVVATCTNKGGTQAPGQNPAPISVSGSQPIPEEEIKNGTTPFNVRTVEPVSPIVGAPDCPNPNWSEEIVDLLFTSATITVEQGGVEVLTIFCDFDRPTTNGVVPRGDVACTQE